MTIHPLHALVALSLVLAGCTMPREAPPDDVGADATPSDASAALPPRIDLSPPPPELQLPKALPPADVVVQPPKPLRRPLPEYPAELQDSGLEGLVIARFFVDVEGLPEAVRIVRSNDKLFSAAVVQAVRAWRFEPARDADGKAVRAAVQMPFRFRLEE